MKGLTELNEIWLSGNKLRALHPQMFTELDSLRFLFLSGNQCVDQDFLNYPPKANIEDGLAECGANYPAAY
jgi:hypothetical protein